MGKILLVLIMAIPLCWELKGQPRKLGEVEDKSGELTEFMVDGNSQYLALGNELGILSILDFATQKELLKVRPHREPIKFIRFNSNKNEVITFSNDEVIFTNLSDGTQSSKISIFDKIEIVDLNTQSNRLYVLAQKKQAGDYGSTKKIFRIDLSTRNYEPVHTASGISDFKVSADGELLYIAKGSKILIKNIGLSLIEKTLQSKEAKSHLDFNPAKPEWLASNDKSIARYWKISTGKSYELRWDAIPDPDEVNKIEQVWILSGENSMLFFGSQGLKVRDIRNPASDIIINSHTGLKIEQVRVSSGGTIILLKTQQNVVEIWNAGDQTGSVPVKRPDIAMTSNASPVQVKVGGDIYAKYKEEIDSEMDLRVDLFKPRGEFERTADYEKRQAEAKKYEKGVLDYYKGLANRETEVALELEQTRLRIIAEKRETDSLRKASLFQDKIRNSYEEFYTRIGAIGSYNPDKEEFPITIDEMTHLVKVPFDVAREFKEGYSFYKVVGTRQLLHDAETLESFNYKIVTDKGKVFSFGKQKKPLVVSGEYKLLQAVLNRSVSSQTQEPVKERTAVNKNEVGSAPKTTTVDGAIVNYFRKKKYHALLIAVSDYGDQRITQLDGPIIDANRLKSLLNNKYTFDSENITFLKNPTRTEIIETFDRLNQKINDQDNLLVFYAGHGIWDEDLKQGFWLPSDSKIDSKAAWLSNARIRDYIGGIKAKHTLLVADACFSGGIFKTREVFIQNRASLELAKLPSRKAITSGSMKTVPDKSVFMEYLLKRLEQNENKLLPTEQLFSSFKIAVMNNSEGQVPQYGDIQGAGDEGGDFVFLKRD